MNDILFKTLLKLQKTPKLVAKIWLPNLVLYQSDERICNLNPYESQGVKDLFILSQYQVANGLMTQGTR